MAFWIVLGTVVIVAIFTTVTILIVKWISRLYDSMDEADRKSINSEKRLWLRAIYYFLSEDYETQKINMIISIVAIALMLCGLSIYRWITVVI